MITDDQKILRSGWLRALLATTEGPDFSQACDDRKIVENTVMHHF